LFFTAKAVNCPESDVGKRILKEMTHEHVGMVLHFCNQSCAECLAGYPQKPVVHISSWAIPEVVDTGGAKMWTPVIDAASLEEDDQNSENTSLLNTPLQGGATRPKSAFKAKVAKMDCCAKNSKQTEDNCSSNDDEPEAKAKKNHWEITEEEGIAISEISGDDDGSKVHLTEDADEISSSLASLASCTRASECELTFDPKIKKSQKTGLAAEFEL